MEDLSEKEQIDQIRAWWDEYGNYVIAGVVAGALILFGINYYQNTKLNTQLEASALFESLANHIDGGNLDEAEMTAGQLLTDYAGTTYAAQSKLAMARLYMDKNRDQDAAEELNELLSMPVDDEIKHVGRLRLAKIYLHQDKAQDVVDLLDGQDNAAFLARYSEVIGDAYSALGRVADAEAAYQAALSDPMGSQSIDRALVQWKILDLPPVEESAEGDVSAGEPATAEPSADESAAADTSVEADEAEEPVEIEEAGGGE